MSEQTQPQNQPNSALVLYDMASQQRVEMKTDRGGKLYKVAHLIGPLTREALLEYERALQVRVTDADADESDEQDARAITSNAFKAAQDFYDVVAEETEGYAFKNPDSWKKGLSRSDKHYVVNNILLAAEFVELPLAAESEACPAEDDETTTYRLRCIYNGHIIVVEHTLKAGSGQDLTDFSGIMGRQLLVQGTQFGQTDQRIPSRALALEVLYDKVKVETKGYVDGRVPLHHKKLVVQRHFRRQQKVVAKNSNGSPTP